MNKLLRSPTFKTYDIINDNMDVLKEYFEGIASCDYYDGLSHQLYLDLDDNTININTEVSSNTWVQRNDGTLIQLVETSGYSDIPEDECYVIGCDLNDFGFQEWMEEMEGIIENQLS